MSTCIVLQQVHIFNYIILLYCITLIVNYNIWCISYNIWCFSYNIWCLLLIKNSQLYPLWYNKHLVIKRVVPIFLHVCRHTFRTLSGTYGPWSHRQPNNWSGHQECGAIQSIDQEYLLGDENCYEQMYYLCNIGKNKWKFLQSVIYYFMKSIIRIKWS